MNAVSERGYGLADAPLEDLGAEPRVRDGEGGPEPLEGDVGTAPRVRACEGGWAR